jgi:hypothetical protein
MNTILLILAIIFIAWWLISFIQIFVKGLNCRLAKWNAFEIVTNLILKIFGC